MYAPSSPVAPRFIIALSCLTASAATGHAQMHATWPPAGLRELPASMFALADEDRIPLTLEETLVIDGMGDDGSLAFFSARDIDVLPDGRLVVADEEGNRIAVISRTGSALAHLGRAGQGPGEFDGRAPRFVATTATHIVAGTIGERPLAVFNSSDYGFHGTVALPPDTSLVSMAGVGGDSIVMKLREGVRETTHMLIVIADLATGDSREILRVPEPPLAVYTRTAPRGEFSFQSRLPTPGGRVLLAASRDYFAVADPLEYAVATFDSQGKFVWGVRVADQRAEMDAAYRQELMRPFRDMDKRRGTSWADSIRFLETKKSAIRRLLIDGEGRLFVFRTPDPESEFRPVDVYSRTGDLLATAAAEKSAYLGWSAVDGTATYTRRQDAEGNTVIVVGRLVLQPER